MSGQQPPPGPPQYAPPPQNYQQQYVPPQQQQQQYAPPQQNYQQQQIYQQQYAAPQPGYQPPQQPNYQPPQGYQHAAPPQYAPAQQHMSDYNSVLGSMPGMVVRQRLRLKSLLPCWLKNKYDIGHFPPGLDPNAPWEDDVFKQQRGLMMASEESECIDKFCCRRYRAFAMHIHAGNNQHGPTVLRFDRPFRCPCLICCYVPWPQEITATDPNTGNKLGSVVQDWRCCSALCGKLYWRARDPQGVTTHVFERDTCCNANCCAPSCCCETHRITIKDASETRTVGYLDNIFPGCSCRTLCCMNLIDNYRLKFPDQANPAEKATLLSGMMLIDYMLFANADDREDGAF